MLADVQTGWAPGAGPVPTPPRDIKLGGPAPRCGNLGGQCALPTGQLGLCCLFEQRTLADGPVCKTFSFILYNCPPGTIPTPPPSPAKVVPTYTPYLTPAPSAKAAATTAKAAAATAKAAATTANARAAAATAKTGPR